MGSYDGMSYEELVAAFKSIDIAPVRASAGSWNQANGKTADLGSLLAKRLSALMHDWKGAAAGAFSEYMDDIHKFCAKLAADEAEMSAGMAELAADGASYKAKAEALLNPPPKNAKEKEKVRKELAKLLGELGGKYRGSEKSYFRTPTKAPASLPKDDDFVQDEPLDVVDTYEGTPDPFQETGPPPGTTPLPPSPTEPVPYVPVLEGGGSGETGLASAAPAALATPGGLGAGGAPGYSPGMSATGLSSAIGPGMAISPSTTPTRTGSGLFGGSGAAHRGRPVEDEEDEGNRTWLTEDEMVWGNAEGTPAPVVDRRG
ncbi:WXG100 family type VII secretion target [Phytomonospora endophytica]|uniref:Uncharacterized protein YukE n=1 Tax=Phytomonospora endophytica TaxID=714109 RepID=A0A841FAT2_9ACTN|nr:hypothetical protein [Phytomonospora endophytica]MBB6032874.1 uncharacterized protein YukE [Phytomonospora endophytica]GIG65100.1 hypothetical protein Pen01_13950 [Phytomonospora endophytica]